MNFFPQPSYLVCWECADKTQVIFCVIVMLLVHNLEPLHTPRFFQRGKVRLGPVFWQGNLMFSLGTCTSKTISANTPGKKWAVAENMIARGREV